VVAPGGFVVATGGDDVLTPGADDEVGDALKGGSVNMGFDVLDALGVPAGALVSLPTLACTHET
jgi:hypothetical protein